MNLRYTGCSKLSLLAVDDDALLLKFFKIHLGNAFDSVVVVSSPVRALEILEERPVDILMSDYEMSEQNGLWLLEQVKSRYPGISLMLMSGAVLPSSVQKTVKAVTDSYLKKPMEMVALRNSLVELAKFRKSYLESHLPSTLHTAASTKEDVNTPTKQTAA